MRVLRDVGDKSKARHTIGRGGGSVEPVLAVERGIGEDFDGNPRTK